MYTYFLTACSLSLLVIIILLVIIPICNVFNVIILALVMSLMKFEFPWTCTTPRKSLKIHKMSSCFVGFFGFFCMFSSLAFSQCFSFPQDLQATHKYKNLQKMKLGKDIWLPITWSNPYNFLTIVVQHCRLHQMIS